MIEIEQSGSLNTIQDLGRPAWRHLGVSVSGVMDPLALRAGNTLLGNEENAAAIEVQMFPFRVRFWRTAGSRSPAPIAGQGSTAMNYRHSGAARYVKAVLELRFPRRGARGYLCVAGGIDVPLVLGSRSTALRGGFGGLEGRQLQRGDVLSCGPSVGAPPRIPGLALSRRKWP